MRWRGLQRGLHAGLLALVFHATDGIASEVPPANALLAPGAQSCLPNTEPHKKVIEDKLDLGDAHVVHGFESYVSRSTLSVAGKDAWIVAGDATNGTGEPGSARLHARDEAILRPGFWAKPGSRVEVSVAYKPDVEIARRNIDVILFDETLTDAEKEARLQALGYRREQAPIAQPKSLPANDLRPKPGQTFIVPKKRER